VAKRLSDAQWEHIWQTKFAVADYYGVGPHCPTTSSILDRMARGENAFACCRRQQRYSDGTGDPE
jgi:hypothetical protein